MSLADFSRAARPSVRGRFDRRINEKYKESP
jgi:hypothetical protein